MSDGLLRSTGVVGGLTAVSRVTGFLRDIILARAFGASASMDAFVVAFQIPNFLRRLFAEGAFSQAFVPVFTEYHRNRDAADVRDLADRVAGTFGAVLFAVTLVGVLAAPLLILLFSSGFTADAQQYGMAVAMLRLTFPYLLFISLTALAAGILNTLGHFAVPAFTPVLLNICLIGGALLVAPTLEQPIYAVAGAVFVAGALQLAFQVPFLAACGMLPRPRWGYAHEGVRRIARLMLPAIFGSSAAQVNLIVDRAIASWLPTGSITWLYFSDRLMEFPLGVFGIALATVILPGLSARHSTQDGEAFSATLDWALRLVFVIMLPAAVGLLVLAGPILTTLFQYGEFTARDTQMAGVSVMAYALGLMGFALVKVLAPGYFARQDTVTPVRFGIVTMLVNVVLNFALVLPMVHFGYMAPHLGLALATALAACLNAALLFVGLRRADVYRPRPGWAALSLRLAVACGLMGFVLTVLAGDLQQWADAPLAWRVARLAALIGGGALVYFVVLRVSGLRLGQLRAPAV